MDKKFNQHREFICEDCGSTRLNMMNTRIIDKDNNKFYIVTPKCDNCGGSNFKEMEFGGFIESGEDEDI